MKRIVTFVLGLSLLATACADPVAPATPTPVVPTITETFTGTVAALGSTPFPITVQQVGGITVTISDITPKVTVGFGIGVQGLTGCAVVGQSTAAAGERTQLTGTMSTPGSYCVVVFDTGQVVDPVSYTLTVLHS